MSLFYGQHFGFAVFLHNFFKLRYFYTDWSTFYKKKLKTLEKIKTRSAWQSKT